MDICVNRQHRCIQCDSHLGSSLPCQCITYVTRTLTKQDFSLFQKLRNMYRLLDFRGSNNRKTRVD